MSIKLIPEEKMMPDAESWFYKIVIYIENIMEQTIGKEEDERLFVDEEKRLTLLSMYNKGFKDSMRLLSDASNRVKYQKNPLSIYSLGIEEYSQKTSDMIDSMGQISERNYVDIEKIHILLIQIYMKGMKDAGDLYRRNRLNEKVVKVIEDIDTILSSYTSSGEDPEEVWEKIKNRIMTK